MAGVGEFYYELRVARRGDAAADEATLRRVSFIKKLQERALFFQDEGGIRIVLERVTQSEHAMGCAVGRLRNDGWNITFRAILAEDVQPPPGHGSSLRAISQISEISRSQDVESPHFLEQTCFYGSVDSTEQCYNLLM